MCGPTGTGVLYGRYELLEEIEPLNLGGSTVSNATFDNYKELKPPYKFEAGLQDYANIIGLKEAVNYLKEINIRKIEKYCKYLGKIIFDELESLIEDKIKVINTNKENINNIFNFYFKKNNNRLTSEFNDFLSKKNIAVRVGKHCVHAYYNKNNLPNSIRASWYFYNNEEEIKIFCNALIEFIKKNNI